MHSVTVRYPKELVARIRHEARQRGVAQSQVWRELGAIGAYRQQIDDERLETVLNLTVQTLCTMRRLAGHTDESLLELAKQDATRVLESLRAP